MAERLTDDERELLTLMRDYWDEGEWADDMDLSMSLGWNVTTVETVGCGLSVCGYLENRSRATDYGRDFKLTDKGRNAI